VLARTAGLAGLIAAYLALVQVVLLARLPVLERLAGFDRLTHWHRWNGHLCIDLVIVHVVLQIWGYSMPTHRSFSGEFWVMVGKGGVSRHGHRHDRHRVAAGGRMEARSRSRARDCPTSSGTPCT